MFGQLIGTKSGVTYARLNNWSWDCETETEEVAGDVYVYPVLYVVDDIYTTTSIFLSSQLTCDNMGLVIEPIEKYSFGSLCMFVKSSDIWAALRFI